jgi:uncharacterized protein (UPF0333 family)
VYTTSNKTSILGLCRKQAAFPEKSAKVKKLSLTYASCFATHFFFTSKTTTTTVTTAAAATSVVVANANCSLYSLVLVHPPQNKHNNNNQTKTQNQAQQLKKTQPTKENIHKGA